MLCSCFSTSNSIKDIDIWNTENIVNSGSSSKSNLSTPKIPVTNFWKWDDWVSEVQKYGEHLTSKELKIHGTLVSLDWIELSDTKVEFWNFDEKWEILGETRSSSGWQYYFKTKLEKSMMVDGIYYIDSKVKNTTSRIFFVKPDFDANSFIDKNNININESIFSWISMKENSIITWIDIHERPKELQ